jgi:hypothetical protein
MNGIEIDMEQTYLKMAVSFDGDGGCAPGTQSEKNSDMKRKRLKDGVFSLCKRDGNVAKVFTGQTACIIS